MRYQIVHKRYWTISCTSLPKQPSVGSLFAYRCLAFLQFFCMKCGITGKVLSNLRHYEHWAMLQNLFFLQQQKAIRAISSASHNAHAEPLFKIYNILKLKDIFNYCLLTFYYNMRNNKFPHYIATLFRLNY